MKNLIVFLLSIAPFFAQSQDTICLPKQRLARIADSLTYYRIAAHGANVCDSLIQNQGALISNQQNQILTLRGSLQVCGEGAMIMETMRNEWRQTASDYKGAHDLLLPQLQKAKKAKRVWVGIALGSLGILAAGVTTAILVK